MDEINHIPPVPFIPITECQVPAIPSVSNSIVSTTSPVASPIMSIPKEGTSIAPSLPVSSLNPLKRSEPSNDEEIPSTQGPTPTQIEQDAKLEKNVKKRSIKKAKTKRIEEPCQSYMLFDRDIDGPYSGVDLNEIWGPLEKNPDMKTVVNSLRTNYLAVLASNAMKMIEEFKCTSVFLNKFMDVLHSDYPGSQDLELDSTVSPDVLKSVRESVQETIGCWDELLDQLSKTRLKVVHANNQKNNVLHKIKDLKKAK